MECPRCGHRQVFAGGAECERCGVIFARLRPQPAAAGAGAAALAVGEPAPAGGSASAQDDDSGPAASPVDAAGWRALGIGAALAVATEALPLLRVLVGHFVVLVHEMGHALAGWIFGRPSIPAFDFTYGGGVTAHLERSTALLLGVWSVFALGLWVFRHNRASLALVAGLAAAHVALVAGGEDEAVIVAMGHGGELLFAALFLHRALSGRGCHLEAERPLYAWIGLHVVLHGARFAWGLATSEAARHAYGAAKGGGHWMDFSRLARDHLGVSLETVAAGFLLACLATPAATVLLHLQRPRVARVLARLTRLE